VALLSALIGAGPVIVCISGAFASETGVAMTINLARGLRRTWLVGTISWIAYACWHYFGHCGIPGGLSYTRDKIRCDFGGEFIIYYPQTEFFAKLLELVIGIPVLAFVVGAWAMWAGKWIAKGFGPSPS
jgi:hypothetical protein